MSEKRVSRRDFVAASALAIPALRGLDPRLMIATSDERMSWWRHARFGLFLHWGLYSVLAGTWKGDEKWAEWIRNNAHIPVKDYDTLLGQWNPHAWDPDAWAAAADRAGMGYAVLTTKHHDGFALFDSKVSEFDVMNTPSQRDICRDLSRALRKRGIRVGWYHSIMDWHHPDYLPRRDWEKDSRPVGDARFSRYVDYLHAQVDELLTNYGTIDVMWFDGQWESTWTHDLAKALEARIRQKQPRIIINNRIDGAGAPKDGGLGDFGTPEQTIPDTGMPGKDWESCITMNDNWGFKSQDHNWKSPRKLIEILVETASKGGNLLLNIGPMADGRWPPEAEERMRAIGEWMRDHQGTIYNTSASLFAKPSGFRSTTGYRELHLFVTDWRPGPLPLAGLRTKPRYAILRLGGGRTSRVPVTFAGGMYSVVLPADAPATLMPVITMRFAGQPVVSAT
jgi:alpha-L-fucosidase